MRKILVRLTGEASDDNVLEASVALGSRLGAEVARTDTEGLLLVARSPDGGLRLWRERS